VCKALDTETTYKWCRHICKPVCGHEGTNRPDTIIKHKQKEKMYILIDVAIPADRNVTQKDAEKKLKYKSLCTEIQRTWNVKCVIIPAVTGATGTVTKGLRKNLEAAPGKHSVDALQNAAVLGT
jgi:hypothetical protein